MSDISDMDPPVRAIVEHKPRKPGFWLENLTGMEAFRYRAWRAGISREIDQACEAFIRSESREAQLVDELLAGSRPRPVESTAQYRDEWQLQGVKVLAGEGDGNPLGS